MPANSISTIFFPLRTNAFFLDDPGREARMILRIKQACILFERVIFEDGIVSITEHTDGVLLQTGPTGSARAIRKGPGKIRMEWIGPDPPKGDEIAGGGYIRYDEVLEGFGLAEQDWVELSWLALSDSERWNSDSDALTTMFAYSNPGRLDLMCLRNLFHDLQLSSHYSNVMPMDSTHEALLDRVLVSSDANYRHEALTKTISLMVPDLGFLDWPEVITVRNMPKIRALRAKIFEIQTEAFLRSRRDRSALLDEVASTVTTVLFETVQELRPKPLRAIAKFMLEFLPFSHLLIAAAEGGELVKDALSWHAVVLRMRSISEGART